MSKEVLSAAVDNAATEAEWDALLHSMERDPALKAEWSRIWESRDAHEAVTLSLRPDFCSGVMAAIANEVPLPSNVVAMPARPSVSPVAQPVRTARSWRTLIPLSAAAGVVAAVLVVGGLRNPPADGAAPTQSASVAPVVATTPVNLPDAGKAAILNDYLMEHSNSLAERSMGSTLAATGFVVRTANYPSDAR